MSPSGTGAAREVLEDLCALIEQESDGTPEYRAVQIRGVRRALVALAHLSGEPTTAIGPITNTWCKCGPPMTANPTPRTPDVTPSLCGGDTDYRLAMALRFVRENPVTANAHGLDTLFNERESLARHVSAQDAELVALREENAKLKAEKQALIDYVKDEPLQ